MPGASSVSVLPPAGSPFVVGRPLRAQEPIFGRDAVLRALADALGHGSSVNLVAPRRMGKTSLLNHLRGHSARWLSPRPDRPPRLLAAVDLQGHITGANRFYAAALRALWLGLPVMDRPPDGPARLADPAGVTYEAFQEALSDLTEGADVPRQPVLLLDEFERLLAPRPPPTYPPRTHHPPRRRLPAHHSPARRLHPVTNLISLLPTPYSLRLLCQFPHPRL